MNDLEFLDPFETTSKLEEKASTDLPHLLDGIQISVYGKVKRDSANNLCYELQIFNHKESYVKEFSCDINRNIWGVSPVVISSKKKIPSKCMSSKMFFALKIDPVKARFDSKNLRIMVVIRVSFENDLRTVFLLEDILDFSVLFSPLTNEMKFVDEEQMKREWENLKNEKRTVVDIPKHTNYDELEKPSKKNILRICEEQNKSWFEIKVSKLSSVSGGMWPISKWEEYKVLLCMNFKETESSGKVDLIVKCNDQTILENVVKEVIRLFGKIVWRKGISLAEKDTEERKSFLIECFENEEFVTDIISLKIQSVPFVKLSKILYF